MDGGKKVWVPHPVEGFKLGRIVDIGSEFITIEPFDAPGTVSSYTVYPKYWNTLIPYHTSSKFGIPIYYFAGQDMEKLTRCWSDAVLCTIWSGSTLFAQ